MKQFEYKDLDLRVIATGGVESCYLVKNFNIAFDFGRGPVELIDMPHVFLSHGHLDHASGIAYYFSQRSLKNLPTGTVYAPEKTVGSLKKICREWQKIEEFEYKIDIRPIKGGQRVDLMANYYVEAFTAYHRVPAVGYALMRRVKKLMDPYKKLSGPEIQRLRESGADIFHHTNTPLLAYSGDTTIEGVLESEIARRARVLIIECTYVDEARPVERARKWGHIHLDEILAHRGEFQNERVILSHLSRRYRPSYVEKVLQEKLTPEDRERFIFLG